MFMVVFMWTAVEGQKHRLYYFIFESLRRNVIISGTQLDDGKDNIERSVESGEIFGSHTVTDTMLLK